MSNLKRSDPTAGRSQSFKDAQDFIEHQIYWFENYANMVQATYHDMDGALVEITTNRLYLENLDPGFKSRNPQKPYTTKAVKGAAEAGQTARYLKQATKVMPRDQWKAVELAFRSGISASKSNLLECDEIIDEAGKKMRAQQFGRVAGSKNKLNPWQKEVKRIWKTEPSIYKYDLIESLVRSGHAEPCGDKYLLKGGSNKPVSLDSFDKACRRLRAKIRSM